MQAWQDELERARQGQREAENKLSSLEVRIFYYFVVKFFEIMSSCLAGKVSLLIVNMFGFNVTG